MVTAFKGCFASWETLRTIGDFFVDMGFDFSEGAEAAEAMGNGQRRSLAAGYIGTLNLTDPVDAGRLLKAMSSKLAEWERNPSGSSEALERFKRVLDVEGFGWDGRVIRAPAAGARGPAAGVLRRLDEDHVNAEVDRIFAAAETDPEDAITAARALVETVGKAVLADLGKPVDDKWDLPDLYKRVAMELKLDPVLHEVVFRQTLQGLVSVVQGLAELRNKLGDAHGKGRGAVRAKPRHARLAAGAAMTIAAFVVETFEEREGHVLGG